MKRLFAFLVGAGLGSSALAQVVLADGNSRANIDPTTSGFLFLRGLNEWTVDGVNHVFQQWYWFRIGDNREETIDTIGAPVITPMGANAVNVAYGNNAIAIDITFTLVGGSPGSRASDIGEIVRVRNLTNVALDFHLFEYDDFDVSATFEDDLAARLDASSIRQYDAFAEISVGAVAAPDHWQIAGVPDIYDLLEDSSASNLADATSGTGPGDFSFAFQWDRQIGPGGTFLMSKNKIVAVPEPASLTALGLAAGALLRRRRREAHPAPVRRRYLRSRFD